jgi:hypothetical protein
VRPGDNLAENTSTLGTREFLQSIVAKQWFIMDSFPLNDQF